MLVIEGMNRTEFCRPKRKRDVDEKRFFETRGQLYRAYPDQFTRMKIREYGIYKGDDEVIFYPENSIHPCLERGTRIDRDKVMADIDWHKILAEDTLFKKKSIWGSLISGDSNKLINILPLAIAGIVGLFAILVNGGI